MPFIQHQHRHLFYQTYGEGTPLILHHGFTSSHAIWSYYDYVSVLSQHFKVITFDAFGHGKSDKPHDTNSYTLALRCQDVLALMDELQIEQAHYLGYSLGGWVGYGLMQYAPERFTSMILGGAHPYADLSWEAFNQIEGDNADMFIETLEQVLQEHIPSVIQMLIRANDLVALTASAQQPRLSQTENLLQHAIPTLFFCGEQDKRMSMIKEYQHTLKDSSFVNIPHVAHINCLMKADFIVPLIKDFLFNLSK